MIQNKPYQIIALFGVVTFEERAKAAKMLKEKGYTDKDLNK